VATSGEGDTSTDDLIAKLKNGGAAAAADAAPPEGGSDGAAARLVAMKLALEGADREAIAARLRSEFGSAGDDGALLDDVLSRAGRG
jgi:hypothetical protein